MERRAVHDNNSAEFNHDPSPKVSIDTSEHVAPIQLLHWDPKVFDRYRMHNASDGHLGLTTPSW